MSDSATHRDIRREQSINLMVDFMKDKIYEGQDISQEELMHTAALYYDLVEAVTEALEKVEREAEAAGKAVVINASNPDQVDLLGGPLAIDRNTTYKGR